MSRVGLGPRVSMMLVIAALLSAACSTTPREPDSATGLGYRENTFRAAHPPYGSILVEKVQDRRPAFELGSENYLNESYYSEELFRRPVVAVLHGVASRELVTTGLFTPPPPSGDPDYLLRISLRHFYAKSDRDLLGLIPILPTIEVEARIVAEILLTDPDGRRFLEKRYDVRHVADTATVGNVPSTGADLLLKSLGELMDRLLAEADRDVEAFWRGLGLDPYDPDLP